MYDANDFITDGKERNENPTVGARGEVSRYPICYDQAQRSRPCAPLSRAPGVGIVHPNPPVMFQGL